MIRAPVTVVVARRCEHALRITPYPAMAILGCEPTVPYGVEALAPFAVNGASPDGASQPIRFPARQQLGRGCAKGAGARGVAASGLISISFPSPGAGLSGGTAPHPPHQAAQRPR